MIKAIYAQ